MSKDQRKVNKQQVIQMKKALREQLKSAVVQEHIIHTQKTYYKLGYEKGYSDGKDAQATDTVS